jgi:hypothetical protein
LFQHIFPVAGASAARHAVRDFTALPSQTQSTCPVFHLPFAAGRSPVSPPDRGLVLYMLVT